MKKLDIKNRKFGRLLVLKEVGINKNLRPTWKCLCDCGNIKITTVNKLTTGNTQSCGCLHKELLLKRITTHGKSNTLTYRIWQDIKDRCLNPKHHSFINYGARGIKVCKDWEKFENFLKDMGEKPKGLSIDRIDNNKGYSKKNCHWATRYEQSRNKRNNKFITFNGKTQCISDWAKELNISQVTLWSRIHKYNFSIKRALTSKKYG